MDKDGAAVHSVGVTDTNRIESLEQAVRGLYASTEALRAEVEQLRSELQGKRGQPGPLMAAQPRPAAPPTPQSPPPVRPAVSVAPTKPVVTAAASGLDLDLEALVGRYGTLALATLTIVLGVGAFVSWAIAHHLLGPVVRVTLGAILAVALVIVGWRLRRKGAVVFSNALLGLALAVVHVDAWGAGPRLNLITSSQALMIAALASVALAAFARRERDQSLFSVGVGGALLAPFVTSDGTSRVIALMIYGFIVLELAVTAIVDDDWVIALSIVFGGSIVYTLAGIAATPHGADLPVLLATPVFALALAAASLFAPLRKYRSHLALVSLALLTVALGSIAGPGVLVPIAILAALGTINGYATLRFIPPGQNAVNYFPVGVLPLALMGISMWAADAPPIAALVAAGYAGAAYIVSTLDDRRRRDPHGVVVGIASLAAIGAALNQHHVLWCSAAMSAHAVIFTLLMRRQRPMLAIPAALSLFLATVLAFTALSARPDYQYIPFLTRESAAALTVSAAWFVFSWYASRLAPGEKPLPLVRVSGLIVAFVCGWRELGYAFSADIATLLLIAYYATVGVVAIQVGRFRTLPLLRHIGLGLAIFAAIKAVIQASDLMIGFRIGGYFLAGLFMLFVAYWYRAADVSKA